MKVAPFGSMWRHFYSFLRKRAIGKSPSPLRAPLPPCKRWGARKYIGARSPLSGTGVGK